MIPPERGVLLSEELLPVAEETGLILHVGEWALQEAWSTSETRRG